MPDVLNVCLALLFRPSPWMCRQLDNHRWLPTQLTPPCQRSCQVGCTVGTMLHAWTFSLYSPSFSLFPPPPLPPSLLPLPPLSSVKQSAVMEAPLPASEQPPPDLFLASDETAADKSSPTAATQEADGDKKTGSVASEGVVGGVATSQPEGVAETVEGGLQQVYSHLVCGVVCWMMCSLFLRRMIWRGGGRGGGREREARGKKGTLLAPGLVLALLISSPVMSHVTHCPCLLPQVIISHAQ